MLNKPFMEKLISRRGRSYSVIGTDGINKSIVTFELICKLFFCHGKYVAVRNFDLFGIPAVKVDIVK